MDSSTSPYELIVDRFPDGIVFLYEDTANLRYTFVGGEGLSELALTKDDLEGHVVAEDRPPEIKEKLHSQYRRALDGEEVTFEIEAEGRHFRFQLGPVTDDTGSITGGFGIAQDITEEVVYQKELERTNKQLEQFTQLLFHDIQSPLNVAQGRLKLLREECDSVHIEPINEALERIDSLTSKETTPLVQRDEAAFSTVALNTIAEDAWRNVATKSADLRIDTERSVRGDSDDLRRLFENLFRNAVEHGGEDVTVTIGDLETGFFVTDDGVGIPESERGSLFERGVSHAEQGTGLGLFIVKRVVNAHGWTISITESSDGGVRFEITGIPSREH